MSRRHLIAPALAIWLPSCAPLPLSYLDADAPIAGRIAQLGWGLLAISIIVVLIIAVLLIGAIVRPRDDRLGTSLAVRRDTGGMRWIYLGVGISTAVLAASVIWTLLTLRAVAAPANTRSPLTIGIRAHQWWWQVDYESAEPSGRFSTANEIHIPTGIPVRVQLRSDDVIHSFWVPKLAGKMDVIPGRTNEMWIEADAPGIYRGQCAEYCGVEHALMGFRVVAEPSAAFAAWRARQHEGPSIRSAAAAQGSSVFGARCGACHSIRGTPFGGAYGPDLTNLSERATLAAGVLRNDPANLARWISNAQEVKPGTRMPDVPLSRKEMAPLIAYLEQQ